MADTKGTGMAGINEATEAPELESLNVDAVNDLIKTALGTSRLLRGMVYFLEETDDAATAEACELMADSLWQAVCAIVPHPLSVKEGAYVK